MPPSLRYEMKYRIGYDEAIRARKWARRFMQVDAFGDGGSGTYDVHSLYLDGADWSIYRDTLNGNFARFKLRARTYGFGAGEPWFLEVKSRSGEAMSKTRARVERAQAARLLRGEWPDELQPTPDLVAFRSQRERRAAFAREWVSYRREAYVAHERTPVRVTFDTDIVCAPPTDDLSAPPRWLPVDEARGQVILEIKYEGSYPWWIAEMIRFLELRRDSMSKYRHAVDALNGRGAALLAVAR